MTAAHGRLSSLDASFLENETETAHMHVGWAAVFSPPQDGPRPTFEELRAHIAERLVRAPRYRQRLAASPLGLEAPVWVDDPDFDVERHVRRAPSDRPGRGADAVMSMPLFARAPLWEIAIAEELSDGSVGIVGKAHHCMVDGIAAVELAGCCSTPRPSPPPSPGRLAARPRPDAGAARHLRGARPRGDAVAAAHATGRVVRSPSLGCGSRATPRWRASALMQSVRPARPSSLNAPISETRRVVRLERPLEDLRSSSGSSARASTTSSSPRARAACASS